MKIRLFLILPILFLIASCHQAVDTTNMTDEEILNVLDVKIDKNPKDAELYFDRAKVLLRLNRVNEAISDANHAIQFGGDKPEYYKVLADSWFANGNVEHAYEALQKAQELDADDDEIILKMGEIAYYSHDYDRAMDHLHQVLEGDPNNRTALFLKSFIYKEKGDTSNAIAFLNKVSNLYPEYAPAFEELGVLYSAHKSPLAEQYLLTANRLDPDNTNILYNLGMYYQDLGKMDKAEETYKKMLEINESDPYAWHNRGYLQLFFYGDYQLAVDYLSRAIACDTTYIEAIANRGCAYELMGEKSKAREDFDHALRLDPNFQPAIDGKKRL